jgi:hypothetical protein
LCIQGFRGQGYSPSFIANLARLVDRLADDPRSRIQLVAGVDDICCFCPHLKAGICARDEPGMNSLDRKILRHLGLSLEAEPNWSSLLDTIAKKVNVGDLPELCGDCRWLRFNYCTNGLARLAASRKTDGGA